MSAAALDVAAVATAAARKDPEATTELYRLCSRDIRRHVLGKWNFIRQSDTADDHFHDCFIVLLASLQGGLIREPGQALAYARQVARRQVQASYHETKRCGASTDDKAWADRYAPDKRPGQLSGMLDRERKATVAEALRGLRSSDREILIRFYFRGQTKEEIQAGMGLTLTQFRLKKTRALAVLAVKAKAILESRSLL